MRSLLSGDSSSRRTISENVFHGLACKDLQAGGITASGSARICVIPCWRLAGMRSLAEVILLCSTGAQDWRCRGRHRMLVLAKPASSCWGFDGSRSVMQRIFREGVSLKHRLRHSCKRLTSAANAGWLGVFCGGVENVAPQPYVEQGHHV